MSHSHYHFTADGRKTSLEVVDPEDAKGHWHTVDGERTGIDEFGAGHSHTFSGIKTTGPVDDDGEGDAKRYYFNCQFKQIEKKQTFDSNGIPVGIVKGYIATWDVDRGDFFGRKDKFIPGAFRESLADMKARNRNVRLKDHHQRTVGNFPIQNVFEDDRGLFGEGHLNLEVQQGKEAYSLALQKSLTEFSIGFTADEFHMEDDVRMITKATIWEGSIVDEPMNPAAVITEVKDKVTVEEVNNMTERDLEKSLTENNFSKNAAKAIIFKGKKAKKYDQDDSDKEILSLLTKANDSHREKSLLETIRQTSQNLSA